MPIVSLYMRKIYTYTLYCLHSLYVCVCASISIRRHAAICWSRLFSFDSAQQFYCFIQNIIKGRVLHFVFSFNFRPLYAYKYMDICIYLTSNEFGNLCFCIQAIYGSFGIKCWENRSHECVVRECVCAFLYARPRLGGV